MTDNGLGLYIHIPFCNKKCAYCDFYSVFPIGKILPDYVGALLKELKRWGGELKNRPIDTIYIGGGTPSLLGEYLADILNTVRENYNVTKTAEITVEANPENLDFLPIAAKCGVNRLSVGAQTFFDCTLKKIGRRHTAKQTENFVNAARQFGFSNISIDLMLGLPESDISSLKYDIKKALSLSPEHISAYILKKEPNTALSKLNIAVADDDEVAKQYLFLIKTLAENGYKQYEISNFCKEGYASKHNLKYWQCKEYLGVGPAAHGFIGKERFYYPDDIKEFIKNPHTLFESTGGDATEKAMLKIRLNEGINLSEYFADFETKRDKADRFKKMGFIEGTFPEIRLTGKGMLLSNQIITELII